MRINGLMEMKGRKSCQVKDTNTAQHINDRDVSERETVGFKTKSKQV